MSKNRHLFFAVALSALVVSGGVGATQAPNRRCGWFSNPTPANFVFSDRDGDWLIGMQGIHHADGLDDVPDLTKRDWVDVQNGYGYGCACMTIVATKKAAGPAANLVQGDRVVVRFRDFQQRSVASCRQDKRLKPRS